MSVKLQLSCMSVSVIMFVTEVAPTLYFCICCCNSDCNSILSACLYRLLHTLYAVDGGTSALQSMQVYRVILADSGTLLICLLDTDGSVAQLRQNLKAAFPGAPTRQTQIIHISVLRLLTGQQLTPDARQRIQAVCDEYTEILKGLTVNATELW